MFMPPGCADDRRAAVSNQPHDLISTVPSFPQRRMLVSWLMHCPPGRVYLECGEMLAQVLTLAEWQRDSRRRAAFTDSGAPLDFAALLNARELAAFGKVQETLTALRLSDDAAAEKADPFRLDPGGVNLALAMNALTALKTAWKEYGRIWTIAMPPGQTSPTALARKLFQYPVRPAGTKDLGRIVAFDQEAFCEDDMVPEETYAQWQSVDPHAFIVVDDADGSIVGYYSLLFIKPGTLQRFTLTSQPREKDFRGQDLCAPEDIPKQRAAYVFSLVASAAAPSLRYALMRNLTARCADCYRSGALRTLYAVAASRQGARLIRRAGFTLAAPGMLRADHYDLYQIELTPEIVRRAERIDC
jgi:hypothetical protein